MELSAVQVGLLMIVLLFLLMYLKMPLGLSMLIPAFLGYYLIRGLNPGLSSLGIIAWGAGLYDILLLIPLFSLMGLLATFVSFRNRQISLVIDGEEVEKEVCTVVVNNGRYGGGGMFTAPDADLADGLLDVLIIGDLNKADLLWSLPRIYKGTHLTHPKVTMRKAKEVEIRSAQKTHLQADGELLGELPSRFRVLPSALNVIV